MLTIGMTSLGLAGSLGDLSSAESRLFAGQPVLRPASGAASWLNLPFDAPVGAVPESEFARSFPLAGHLGQYLTRQLRVAVAGLWGMERAVVTAVDTWGPERVALVLGSSTGGIEATEEALIEYQRSGAFPQDYSLENSHSLDALLWWVKAAFGIEGPGYVVSTACSSSAKALAAGARMIRTGRADAVLVGGVDSLCRLTLRGFQCLGILSSRTCRPFMADRDGLNIGEGAAWALLERDAPAIGYVLGSGESSDAFHMTRPHPDGVGAIACMRAALEQAGLAPADIGYINAHGTGTPLNDLAEAQALHSVFAESQPATSSTKSLTGHQLGAAGMTEAVISLLALRAGRTPVTPRGDSTRAAELAWLNLPDPGVSAPLGRPYALSNSFAFGGSNASIVLGSSPRAMRPSAAVDAEVVAYSLWGRGFASLSAWRQGFYDPTVQVPAAELLSARARGRASLLTRMFCEVVGGVASEAALNLPDVALIFASSLGEMGTTLELLQQMLGPDSTVSPARFQLSVHNAALGSLQIATGHAGFGTSLSAGSDSFAMGLVEALAVLQDSGRSVILACAEEPVLEPLSSVSYPPLAYAIALRPAAPGVGLKLELRGPIREELAAPTHRAAPELIDYFAPSPIASGLHLLSAALEESPGELYVDSGGHHGTGPLTGPGADRGTSGWHIRLFR